MISKTWSLALGAVLLGSFFGCYTGPNLSDGAAATRAGAPNAAKTAEGGTGAGLPCDVEALLSAHCTSCHSDPPTTGPMGLVSYGELVAPSLSDPSRPVAQLALDRMRDTKKPMPPSASLSAADIATFANWVTAGTPASGCGGEAAATRLDGGGMDCMISSDCGGDLICRNGVCDVECVSDKDCGPSFKCKQTRCLPSTTGAAASSSDSGTGAAEPPPYRDFTDPTAWSTADLGALTKTTYNGSAFDGRYVYFAPDGNSGKVLRFDTDASFAGSSGWSVFDLAALDSKAVAYRGAVFDGRYVYLVPSGSGGIVARFDSQASFTDSASWSLFGLATLNVYLQGFTGATFDGRYVYFVPGFGTMTARLDTHAAFTTAAAWSSFSIATVAPTAYSFAGAAYDGRYVYYVPWRSATTGSGVITRYDPQSGFGDAASWTALDLTTLSATAKGFHTAAFDGRYLYLVPGWTGPTPSWSSTTMARLDTKATFRESSAWTFFDMSALGPDASGFNAASFDGRYLVLSPGVGGGTPRGAAYRYDTQADLATAGSWSRYDTSSLRTALVNLKGAAFDGRYVYFAPVGGAAARFDAKTTKAMAALPAFNGSFF